MRKCFLWRAYLGSERSKIWNNKDFATIIPRLLFDINFWDIKHTEKESKFKRHQGRQIWSPAVGSFGKQARHNVLLFLVYLGREFDYTLSRLISGLSGRWLLFTRLFQTLFILEFQSTRRLRWSSKNMVRIEIFLSQISEIESKIHKANLESLCKWFARRKSENVHLVDGRNNKHRCNSCELLTLIQWRTLGILLIECSADWWVQDSRVKNTKQSS